MRAAKGHGGLLRVRYQDIAGRMCWIGDRGHRPVILLVNVYGLRLIDGLRRFVG